MPALAPTSKQCADVGIRRAVEADAAAIAAIWVQIAAERIHSAIDRPCTIEEQRQYIGSLSEREAVHVAEDRQAIIGFQTFDLYSRTIHSMRHVAQIGTFLIPEWRGRGVGRALFERTSGFARKAGYEKFVIQVRASNADARRFYGRLGFVECGKLHRQVRIGDVEDDEVLMECFL